MKQPPKQLFNKEEVERYLEEKKHQKIGMIAFSIILLIISIIIFVVLVPDGIYTCLAAFIMLWSNNLYNDAKRLI